MPNLDISSADVDFSLEMDPGTYNLRDLINRSCLRHTHEEDIVKAEEYWPKIILTEPYQKILKLASFDRPNKHTLSEVTRWMPWEPSNFPSLGELNHATIWDILFTAAKNSPFFSPQKLFFWALGSIIQIGDEADPILMVPGISTANGQRRFFLGQFQPDDYLNYVKSNFVLATV